MSERKMYSLAVCVIYPDREVLAMVWHRLSTDAESAWIEAEVAARNEWPEADEIHVGVAETPKPSASTVSRTVRPEDRGEDYSLWV